MATGAGALFSCSKDAKPEDVALQAAKAYYDQLIHGDYAQFVAGTAGYDSLHESYREQLEVNMKQFIANQKATHVGIDSVVALRATIDTIKASGATTTVADAFLALCYADSTREEVLVPMVKKGEIWMMR